MQYISTSYIIFDTVHFAASLEYLVTMNAYIAVSCLLALVNVASASGGLGYGYGPALGYDHGASLGYDHGGVVGYAPVAAEVGSIPNPGYSFNYAVNDPHTGDNKAQWETRHGDVVTGSYSLVEPDGNLRVVEYTADPIRGFNAVVKRTGPNVHSVALPAKVAVAPVAIAPIAHELPIAEPIYPAPILDYHIEEPWLHGAPTYLSGSSYGHSGHMVRRWAAGPIDLHGKTLTIKTKH